MSFRPLNKYQINRFGWILNTENGTINSIVKDKLILGCGIAEDIYKWNELAKIYNWIDYHEIPSDIKTKSNSIKLFNKT